MTALLLEFAIRTALIAAGTAAVLRLLGITSASARHAAWSAVVVSMLVLPLTLTSGVRLSLPLLAPAAIDYSVPNPATVISTAAPAPPSISAPVTMTSSSAPERSTRIDWRWWLAGLYVAGAMVLLLRLAIGTWQANRLRRTATLLSGRLTSDRCATPITVGWFHPVLILPRGWERWSPEQLAVVLAHEHEHARRHDPLTQWLALFNRAIFWWHPLSWWLEHRLATLAEEACDTAVIAAGHAPVDYSTYLLEMARTVSRAHGRVRLVGMAMPGAGLPQRIRLILQRPLTARMSRTRVVATAASCAAATALFASGTPQRTAPEGGEEKFDVVSIKPCADVAMARTGRGAGPNLAQTSPGHVYWACVTLASLVDQAYGGWDFPLLNRKDGPLALETTLGRPAGTKEDSKRVRGGPEWVYTDRFAIEATASIAVISPAGGNLLRLPAPMNRALRAMLADRFKLEMRRETEERPMYALTIAKSGLKARPRGPDDCVVPPADAKGRPRLDGFWEGQWLCGMFLTAPRELLERFWAGEKPGNLGPGPNRRIEYRGVTLTRVTEYLSSVMDRFVLDKTGVSGEFLFAVAYSTNEQAPGGGMAVIDRPTGPGADRQPKVPEGRGDTIFQAFDAVGLRIEPAKGPSEYLVIDRAERPSPDAPAMPPATAPTPGTSRPR